MKISRHYKWQTKWTVDIAAGTAVHDGGLTVRYIRDGVLVRAVPVNGPEILESLIPKNGLHNAPLMLDRLIKEALEMHELVRSGRARRKPAGGLGDPGG